MREEISQNESKSDTSQKLLVGLGVAAVVGIVFLLIHFLRASDPAASGPIPYKKFDYGAHMQEQTKDYHRTDRNIGAPQSGGSATH